MNQLDSSQPTGSADRCQRKGLLLDSSYLLSSWVAVAGQSFPRHECLLSGGPRLETIDSDRPGKIFKPPCEKCLKRVLNNGLYMSPAPTGPSEMECWLVVHPGASPIGHETAEVSRAFSVLSFMFFSSNSSSLGVLYLLSLEWSPSQNPSSQRLLGSGLISEGRQLLLGPQASLFSSLPLCSHPLPSGWYLTPRVGELVCFLSVLGFTV